MAEVALFYGVLAGLEDAKESDSTESEKNHEILCSRQKSRNFVTDVNGNGWESSGRPWLLRPLCPSCATKVVLSKNGTTLFCCYLAYV